MGSSSSNITNPQIPQMIIMILFLSSLSKFLQTPSLSLYTHTHTNKQTNIVPETQTLNPKTQTLCPVPNAYMFSWVISST